MQNRSVILVKNIIFNETDNDNFILVENLYTYFKLKIFLVVSIFSTFYTYIYIYIYIHTYIYKYHRIKYLFILNEYFHFIFVS